MDAFSLLGRALAFLFAAALSYILYRVVTGAYAQYKNNTDVSRRRIRNINGYERVPSIQVTAEDEDEGYHDAESFEIERSPDLQKPLPERPLPAKPDKPLPSVPGIE